jgi:hypothetical protein
MRRAEVLMHGIPAGILEEIETAKKWNEPIPDYLRRL